MFRMIIAVFMMTAGLMAQSFSVEKVSGKAQVLKGSGEQWTDVKSGDRLSGSDMLVTADRSLVQLSQKGSMFVLKGNSALSLGSIRKLTVNELLLALAVDDLKGAPRKKSNSNSRNTAVYGSETNNRKGLKVASNDLGKKRINGARQLAENGFKESSVIVARETFRKYPETSLVTSDRLYFAAILESLGLDEEAYNEYVKINTLTLKQDEKELVGSKLRTLALKLEK